MAVEAYARLLGLCDALIRLSDVHSLSYLQKRCDRLSYSNSDDALIFVHQWNGDVLLRQLNMFPHQLVEVHIDKG